MLKRTITYTDFNDVERTEDFYFNLSKAELIKWLSTNGEYTLDKLLEKLYQQGNAKELMRIFEELILASYGEKSLDGRLFVKNDKVIENFRASEAYSVLFIEIVTDAKKAAEFFNGIMPKDVVDAIRGAFDENPEGIPDALKDYYLDVKK